MRKYFTLLYITFSVMSFAQFTDNVFDHDKAASTNQQQSPDSNVTESEINPNTFTPNEQDQSASLGVPGPGDEEEGPGNPGEPVPINDYVPFLLLAGLILILYYQIKNKKINI